MYITELSIGTPPQHFRAVLELCFDGIFVPSVDCRDEECHDGHNLYNASESSTFKDNNLTCAVRYGGVQTYGSVVTDSAWIGDMEVKEQTFEAADRLWTVPGYWYDVFDGVLGLGQHYVNDQFSTLLATSFLRNIVKQETLDRNIFALKLPQSEDEPGDLMFGAVDKDLYVGDLITLPLTDRRFDDSRTDLMAYGGWQTAIQAISFGPSTDNASGLSINLPNHVAVLATNNGGTQLSNSIADMLNLHLNISQYDGNPYQMSCDKIGILPNLTFTFDAAQQRQVTLEPKDYMVPVTDIVWLSNHPSPALEKVSCVLPFSQWEPDVPEFVLLGNSFLKGVYTVVDLDQDTVSCKFSPWLYTIA
jgi:hypothetical protein